MLSKTSDGDYTIRYLQFYDRFFAHSAQSQPLDWSAFSSNDSEIVDPIADRVPDFEMTVQREEQPFTIVDLFFSCLYAVADLPKAIIRKIILLPLYPAQSTLVSFFCTRFQRTEIADMRLHKAQTLKNGGFCFRHIVLRVNDIAYSALLVGHTTTITNGRWALQAIGNGMTAESSIDGFADFYGRLRSNVLIVNAPQVGASLGSAIPEEMGAAQHAGICFLEQAIKAKKIAIVGMSFGGAAIASAIMKHNFKNDRQYFVLRQVSFSSVSAVCSAVVESITKSAWVASFIAALVKWSGLEIDCIEASRKLAQRNIPEGIVQAKKQQTSESSIRKEDFLHDGLIPQEASLGYKLVEQGMCQNTAFLGDDALHHNDGHTIVELSRPVLAQFMQ